MSIVCSFMTVILALAFSFFFIIAPIMEHIERKRKTKMILDYQSQPENTHLVNRAAEAEKLRKVIAELEDRGECPPKAVVGINAQKMCKKYHNNCNKCLTDYVEKYPQPKLLSEIYPHPEESERKLKL